MSDLTPAKIAWIVADGLSHLGVGEVRADDEALHIDAGWGRAVVPLTGETIPWDAICEALEGTWPFPWKMPRSVLDEVQWQGQVWYRGREYTCIELGNPGTRAVLVDSGDRSAEYDRIPLGVTARPSRAIHKHAAANPIAVLPAEIKVQLRHRDNLPTGLYIGTTWYNPTTECLVCALPHEDPKKLHLKKLRLVEGDRPYVPDDWRDAMAAYCLQWPGSAGVLPWIAKLTSDERAEHLDQVCATAREQLAKEAEQEHPDYSCWVEAYSAELRWWAGGYDEACSAD